MHTAMGFSTGKWDGDILVVTTTHLKEGWTRRNGLTRSDSRDGDRALHPAWRHA